MVSHHYWPENFRITDICEALVQQGVAVDVLCGLPNYPMGEFAERYSHKGPFFERHNGVNIYRVAEIPRKGNTTPMIFLNYMSYPLSALLRTPRFRNKQYDAVFCYQTSPVFMAWPALQLAKKKRIPSTVYVLDLWPENLYSVLPLKNPIFTPAKTVLKALSHQIYRGADRLIALSEGAKGHLLAITGKEERDIRVIPQYCEDFYAGRPAVSPAVSQYFKGECNILFAGNVSPAQSLPTLVDAALLADKEARGALHYVIAGDGMSFEELKALVRQKGAEHLFSFAGRREAEEIPQFQAAADGVWAGLTKAEHLGFALPAKIASYFAAGKPIFASMEGEGARVVKEADAGYVSPAEDSGALAQNLLDFLKTDAEERAAMGRRGFAYYKAHYCREPLMQQLSDFIFGAEENI